MLGSRYKAEPQFYDQCHDQAEKKQGDFTSFMLGEKCYAQYNC